MPTSWPIPLPGWFWTWAGYLDRGSIGTPPKGTPATIPAWAYERYAIHLGFDPDGYLTRTVGAFVVDSSAFDPRALWQRTPPRDWWALKWGGSDYGGQNAFRKTAGDLRAFGSAVSVWVTDSDFPNPVDMAQAVLSAAVMVAPLRLAFVVFQLEAAYKRNGPEDGWWRAESLTEAWKTLLKPLPAAFISYGKADTEINLRPLLLAGWPVFAECYDTFQGVDPRPSYHAQGWPTHAIKPVVRSLHPVKGESIYRPEGLDP